MSLDVTVSETFGAGIIQAPAKLEAPTIARATRGRCAGRRPRLWRASHPSCLQRNSVRWLKN